MPHERVTSNRERRAHKVRSDAIVRGDAASITSDILRQDDLPENLQEMKDHYVEALLADEVQKQKRIKVAKTIGEMSRASKGALLSMNDDTTDAVNYLIDQPMRQTQRDTYIQAIDDVDEIVIEAVQEGLEVDANIVNQISNTDPRSRKRAKVVRERSLSAKERIVGKIVEEV